MEALQSIFYALGSMAAGRYIVDRLNEDYIKRKKGQLERHSDAFFKKIAEYKEYLTPRFELWWSEHGVPEKEHPGILILSISSGATGLTVGNNKSIKEASLQLATWAYGENERQAAAAKIKDVNREAYMQFTKQFENDINQLRASLIDAGVNVTLLEEKFSAP